jgi:hypothetical protein
MAGSATFDLQFRKQGDRLLIQASSLDPQPLCLTAGVDCVELSLPPFQVDTLQALPPAGSPTVQAKILSASENGFEIEGLAGSTVALNARFVRTPVQVSRASFEKAILTVRFPAGEGYQRTTVRFTYVSSS